MTYGAVYIRVSTDDQIEFSPDAQLKALKKYAKQNDITILKEHIYIDEGISGRTADKRPAFMRMIGTAKLESKPFDIILVHKFDRFARSREDSVVYKSLLRRECGIKVTSITESIEDDKFSVILEAMLEAMAEYYSLNLAEEVRKGMTEKAERGGLQCAASYGYRVENNILVPVEKEAAIVRLIFEKFANREMTMRQLAMYVNDLGARTHRGNTFENRTIHYILRNPVYIGKLRWAPERKANIYRHRDNPDAIIRDGKHEALISMELWDKVHKVLSENKELYPYKQREKSAMITWLKGLVFCGNCGKALVKSNLESLQCGGYNKGACNTSCSILVRILEDIVLEELRNTFTDKIKIDIVPKKADTSTQEELAMLQLQLQKLDVREQRIKEAYQDEIDTLEEYKKNKTQLSTDREQTIQLLAELKTSLETTKNNEPYHKEIENLYALLTDTNIDMQTKYEAAHFVIDKITYTRQDKILKIRYK